jgi:hypothetical protein
LEAITLKPGGSSVTLSPWLIHTSSRPWPSSLVRSWMPRNSRNGPGADLGIAELALAGALDLAAQLGGHGLHAVADAKHRHPDLEHRHRRLHLARLDTELGPPDRMIPSGAKLRMKSSDTSGMDFAVHLLLAHAAGDELSDLGAEIEDQDFLVHGGVRRVKTGRPAL